MNLDPTQLETLIQSAVRKQVRKEVKASESRILDAIKAVHHETSKVRDEAAQERSETMEVEAGGPRIQNYHLLNAINSSGGTTLLQIIDTRKDIEKVSDVVTKSNEHVLLSIQGINACYLLLAQAQVEMQNVTKEMREIRISLAEVKEETTSTQWMVEEIHSEPDYPAATLEERLNHLDTAIERLQKVQDEMYGELKEGLVEAKWDSYNRG